MCEERGAKDEGLKESTNYEVKSTVAARHLACGRGAIISHSCPAPLSSGEGLGVRPGAQVRRTKCEVRSKVTAQLFVSCRGATIGLDFARPPVCVNKRIGLDFARPALRSPSGVEGPTASVKNRGYLQKISSGLSHMIFC